MRSHLFTLLNRLSIEGETVGNSTQFPQAIKVRCKALDVAFIIELCCLDEVNISLFQLASLNVS